MSHSLQDRPQFAQSRQVVLPTSKKNFEALTPCITPCTE